MPLARRTSVLVTLLFTDIVGSTSVAEEMGDRRWRELLARHHPIIRGRQGVRRPGARHCGRRCPRPVRLPGVGDPLRERHDRRGAGAGYRDPPWRPHRRVRGPRREGQRGERPRGGPTMAEAGPGPDPGHRQRQGPRARRRVRLHRPRNARAARHRRPSAPVRGEQRRRRTPSPAGPSKGVQVEARCDHAATAGEATRRSTAWERGCPRHCSPGCGRSRPASPTAPSRSIRRATSGSYSNAAVRGGRRPGQWIERLAIERGRSGGRSEVDGAAVHAGALGGEAYASWRPLIATAILGQPIWESG